MGNEVGTASNFEDLFGKIVTFLTTNAALVAANQQWQVLRQRRDNILLHTSNLADAASGTPRMMQHTFRYDPRSLNFNNPAASDAGSYFGNNWSSGVSHNTWRLRQAREVAAVRLIAPLSSANLNILPKSFRLQHSIDSVTWTTALTVTNAAGFLSGEMRDFAVPAATGVQEYWRILWDATQSSTTTGYICWAGVLLLQSDGTVANHFGSEVIFKALGNSGTEAIYTGIRSEYDSAAGWYNLFVNGYTGYDPNVLSWFLQPGALPGYGAAYPKTSPMVPCWDAAMPYWFSASGRSFRFGIKVSTNYEGGYLGFILPYATPGQHPYPLAVGGSLVPNSANRSANWRYSFVGYEHGVFPAPGADTGSQNETIRSTLYLRDVGGEWRHFANRPNAGGITTEGIQGFSSNYVPPFQLAAGFRSVWPHCENDKWSSGRLPYRECLGGGYIMQPCVLLQRIPSLMVYGELEGVYSTSGYQNTAENTATYAGKTHVVFQNAYRNTAHEFWALSLD